MENTNTTKAGDLSGNTILNFIRGYWVLLALFASIIGTFTENRLKFQDLDGRVEKVEIESNGDGVAFLQLQKDVVEIKTSLFYIQKSLDNNKK